MFVIARITQRLLHNSKNLHFLFSNLGQIPSSHFLTLFSKKHRYMLSSRYWGSSYKLGVRTEAYWSTRERLRIYQKKVLLQFSAASLYKRYLYNGREVLGKCIPYAQCLEVFEKYFLFLCPTHDLKCRKKISAIHLS